MNTLIESKPRYEILDGLRGVAALLVVAFHLFEAYASDHTTQIVNHGYLAVDFFFVLSGYVVAYAYDDRWGKMSVWTFFKRRVIRLHPLVVIGTLLGAALFYFSAGAKPWPMVETIPWWKTLLTMLICLTILPLPKSFDIRGWSETNPFAGPVWSLQYEYLANICYALCIRRFKTWMLIAATGFAAFLTLNLTLNWDVFNTLSGRAYAAYTVIGGWSVDLEQISIGISRLAYPFLAGLLLARFKAKVAVTRGGFALCSALVAAALGMPYFAPKALPVVNGLYEAMTILLVFPLVVVFGAGARLNGRVGSSVCRFLGDISYPLYMVHFPFVYMFYAWKNAHEAAPLGTHVLSGVSIGLLTVAVAWASFKLYDLPVRNWLSGLGKPKERGDR